MARFRGVLLVTCIAWTIHTAQAIHQNFLHAYATQSVSTSPCVPGGRNQTEPVPFSPVYVRALTSGKLLGLVYAPVSVCPQGTQWRNASLGTMQQCLEVTIGSITETKDEGKTWDCLGTDATFKRVGAEIFAMEAGNQTGQCFSIPQLCISGGFVLSGSASEQMADVRCASLSGTSSELSWQQHASLPSGRAFHSITYHIVTGTVFLIGGRRNNDRTLLYGVVDPSAGCAIMKWTVIETLAPLRTLPFLAIVTPIDREEERRAFLVISGGFDCESATCSYMTEFAALPLPDSAEAMSQYLNATRAASYLRIQIPAQQLVETANAFVFQPQLPLHTEPAPFVNGDSDIPVFMYLNYHFYASYDLTYWFSLIIIKTDEYAADPYFEYALDNVQSAVTSSGHILVLGITPNGYSRLSNQACNASQTECGENQLYVGCGDNPTVAKCFSCTLCNTTFQTTRSSCYVTETKLVDTVCDSLSSSEGSDVFQKDRSLLLRKNLQQILLVFYIIAMGMSSFACALLLPKFPLFQGFRKCAQNLLFAWEVVTNLLSVSTSLLLSHLSLKVSLMDNGPAMYANTAVTYISVGLPITSGVLAMFFSMWASLTEKPHVQSSRSTFFAILLPRSHLMRTFMASKIKCRRYSALTVFLLDALLRNFAAVGLALPNMATTLSSSAFQAISWCMVLSLCDMLLCIALGSCALLRMSSLTSDTSVRAIGQHRIMPQQAAGPVPALHLHAAVYTSDTNSGSSAPFEGTLAHSQPFSRTWGNRPESTESSTRFGAVLHLATGSEVVGLRSYSEGSHATEAVTSSRLHTSTTSEIGDPA